MQLKIEGTAVTPEVDFDIEAKRFVMRGRSMPEDSEKFYLPILSWLQKNVADKGMKANFDMIMDYYNTGSFIRLMAIFNLLAELNDEGNKFTVRWFCEEGDQDNIDDGQSFKDVVKVPFEILVI